MKNKITVKACKSCNAVIKILNCGNNENCEIKCCGEEMKELIPNSVDAAVEKHVPTYEKVEDEIYVKVNHVMEKEHYIEWISLVHDNKEYSVTLYPEQNAEVRFPDIPGSTIYSDCNKHGLWKKEVE